MPDKPIDAYLRKIPEHKRAALRDLQKKITSIIPNSEQVMSYGMPGFRLDGKVVAGFAAFKNHLSYFPHSGSVLPKLRADLAKYKSLGIVATTKATLQFPYDVTLPKTLVKKLIDVRIDEGSKSRAPTPKPKPKVDSKSAVKGTRLTKEFRAMLEKSPAKGGWTYVVMPGSAKFFGTKGRVKVRGTIDGEPFETSFMALGDGRHKLPVSAAIRKSIGKEAGAKVTVRLSHRLS